MQYTAFSNVIFWLIMVLIFTGICVGIGRDCERIRRDRSRDRSQSRSRPSYTYRPPHRIKDQTPRTQYSEIQLAMCPECEATILAEATVCPHCGAPQPVCMVCQNSIVPLDSTLSCPRCRGQAHRIHFLEYLKVKGKCPECNADLDPHELIDDSSETPFPSSTSGPQHLCMVCNRAIGSTDATLQCPHCEGRAHRVHFLEYLKVKGKCPHCNADLDPPDLIET
ncbi:MAG: zinc-ribbon domain-containing protein [Promethearchaeota archaeon]